MYFSELKDHYASTDQLIDRQYQPELLKAIVQRNPSVFKNASGIDMRKIFIYFSISCKFNGKCKKFERAVFPIQFPAFRFAV